MITLKAARVNAGMTQAKACKLLGVSTSTMSAWENGETMPRIDMAVKMAKIYNTSIDQIIFKEGDQQK